MWKRMLPLLLIWCCACENKDALPDDKPRIVEVEVLGIDNRQISIDHVKNVITVELPEDMNEPVLYTKVKLTKGAELVSKMHGTTLNLATCSEEDNSYLITRNDAGVVRDTVKYVVQFIQKAPLKVELDDESLDNRYEIAKGELFHIKVRNFLDGSPGEIHLEHQTDRSAPKIVLASCDFQFKKYHETITSEAQLELGIPATAKVIPGLYTVSLHKENGRTATASKTLLLTKGPIRLSWSGYLPQRSINGAPVMITGYNLYESNNLSIVLTDTEGKKHQTKITKYDPFGLSLTLDPGRGIQPGYYTLQIFTNGKLATHYNGNQLFQNYRFAVTKTAQHPFILIFEIQNDLNQEYSDVAQYRDKPVTFIRELGTGYVRWGFVNRITSRLWFDVELESVTQPGYTKRTSIGERNLGMYPEGEEWLSGDAFYSYYPPGKYRFRVVITNPETAEEYKSEPFERLIEIR